MKVIDNYRGLVIGLEQINLDDFPALKVLGCNATGLDHIDLEECKRRSIKIISLNDFPYFKTLITSTAEHTIGLLIALMRNYKIALNAPYKDREEYIGHKLNGKTLGIIGYGRIGKQVEKMAKGFGMEVLIDDVKFTNYSLGNKLIKLFEVMGLVKKELFMSNLEVLISKSDIVSLHIPLEGNEGFFTREMLSNMKSTAFLINTSRDGIIEKGALKWALENKIIAGAAVDFIDDSELVEYAKTHDNLILTNHISGATIEDMSLTENFIIKQVENYVVK